jgi:arylsulfatase A-like enzyme
MPAKTALFVAVAALAMAQGGTPAAAEPAGKPLAAAPRISPARRPNFVIILADDLGYADVGFNGRREFKTPNLDRLAAEGTNFTRFYSAGVVCGPSRASMLTGRYTIHHGVTANGRDLPPAETTIAEALKPLGYRSGLFGKWDNGATPLDHGFDEFAGYLNDIEAWEHFPKSMWFGRESRPVHGFSADLISGYGVDFVTRHRNEPFFLYLAFIEPHLKLEAPPADVAGLRDKIQEYDPQHPYNATYAAMITRLDAAVGRFLDALKAQGLDGDTIVVLTSDNGATFESGNLGAAADLDSNRPFRGGKRSVLEGGSHMPAAIRWPGRIPAGRVSDAVLSQIDILPTFMAAAGAEPDPAWKVDGADELAVWEGKASPAARTLFWEYRNEGWYGLAAMSGDWKLVVESKVEFSALKAVTPIPSETVQTDEAAWGAYVNVRPATPPPPEILRNAVAATGTMDAPKLYNVANDPGERRNYYFGRPAISQKLRGDLLSWLGSETDASKGAPRAPAPPAADGPD